MNDVVIETLDLVEAEESGKDAVLSELSPEQRAAAVQALTDEVPSEKFVQFEEDVS